MSNANYQAWDIRLPASLVSTPLDQRVRIALSFGVLAPSVHNTQPWQFSQPQPDIATITIEPSRVLKVGDATGRQTAISLGACAENVCQAAEALGLTTVLTIDDQLLTIRFKLASHSMDRQKLEAIRNRRSNRSEYRPETLEPTYIRKLAKVSHEPNIQIVVSGDQKLISLVAELTGRGIGMALSLPEFKSELAELMLPNWTSSHVGMPGSVLGKGLIRSAIDPMRFHYLPVSASELRREQALMQSAAAVALVLSRGDTWPFWVEAGRTYQRLGITASALHIDQATSAAAVEAPEFHAQIEDYVKTTYRLQAVMRLGHGRPVGHSPRLGLQAILH